MTKSTTNDCIDSPRAAPAGHAFSNILNAARRPGPAVHEATSTPGHDAARFARPARFARLARARFGGRLDGVVT